MNMPLLYGEGGCKAFMRLQLEIVKKSDDESIFASKTSHPFLSHVSGMLADRPAWFKDSGSFHSIVLRTPIFEQKPYSMTNRGLKIRLPSTPTEDGSRYVLLHCCAGCETSSKPRHPRLLPGDAQQHQWLAVRLVQRPNGRWERKTNELHVLDVDQQQFAIDPKAMFVTQGYL